MKIGLTIFVVIGWFLAGLNAVLGVSALVAGNYLNAFMCFGLAALIAVPNARHTKVLMGMF